MVEAVTDTQVRARKRLIEMERVLGRTMHRVTYAVLVEGMSMETLAKVLFDREGEVAMQVLRTAVSRCAGRAGGGVGLAGRG